MIQMEHVHQSTKAQLSVSECCATRWNMVTKAGIKHVYQNWD